MKTRLEIRVVAGLAAFVGSHLGIAQTAGSAQNCQEIDAATAIVADLATFSSNGTIDSGLLQGTSHFTGDPTSVVQIISQVSPPLESMTFSYTGDTVISAVGGTLTLRGSGVFERRPFGVGTLFSRVLSGTGAFTNASGSLYLNFSSDDKGNLTGSVTGNICLPSPVQHIPPP